MVQWPGRRGKMVKWRTPFGKWASYAIYGTYAFIGWNLIPVAVYSMRKRTYEAEYLEGKHSRRFDQLNSTEQYFAFFGWRLENTKKKKIDFRNWTVEEFEAEEGVEQVRLVHELPAHVQEQLDFESRQTKLEGLRQSVIREPIKDIFIPGNEYIFPPNAIFEA